MIEDKVLESNVTVLRTPLVDIEVVDENDNNISFDIVESWNPIHTVYIDNDESKITEVKDFEEKQIRIKTSLLEIGKKYYVKTSVPIESRDSDEHLFKYGLSNYFTPQRYKEFFICANKIVFFFNFDFLILSFQLFVVPLHPK